MAEFISFQPTDFFNTVLYTGTGAEQTISGVGFEPGLTWCKDRTNSYDQVWYDAARGATKRITSNTDTAESDQAQGLKSWNSDGFVVGTGSNINNNTNNFVSWNWKAGTTSGLSGGTLTPTAYSINTTSGFGAYKYSGTGATATIAHGLGVAPGLIIVKRTDATANWPVYQEKNTAAPATDYLLLNLTNVTDDDVNLWNDTVPTSTVFTIKSDCLVNNSSGTYVAYCFAPVKGYSQFGGYTGNGDANGPFCYTGFRPAYIMIKKTSGTGDWVIFDSVRSPSNVTKKTLLADTAGAEGNVSDIDILSNGFKLGYTDSDTNSSGGTYVYMAFAEFPFVSSNSKPGTAR